MLKQEFGTLLNKYEHGEMLIYHLNSKAWNFSGIKCATLSITSIRESGLVGSSIVIRLRRLPVQTPLVTWLGLET